MKHFILVFITTLLCCFKSGAQDGSDIKYFEIKAIDSTFIGKVVHIDFYNKSFTARKIDTIEINVRNKPLKFIEHREDNGFNNWFSEQYLFATNYNESGQLRIAKSIIKATTKDSILVSNQFEFYNSKNSLLLDKSFVQDNWFNKKIIYAVLVKSEQCCK